MPRMFRIVAVVAMVASSLAAAGTAHATNTAVVTPSPALSIRSSAVPLWLSLNVTHNIQCADMAGSGTVNATTTGPLPLAFGSVTPVMPSIARSACNVGGLPVYVTCAPMTLSATGITTGLSRTPVQISGISCHVAAVSAPTCHQDITGSVTGVFDDATNALTLNPPWGQTLVALSTTCSTVLPNSGTVTWTDYSGGQPVIQATGAGGTGTVLRVV
jgi:hypothetical protein